MQHPMEELCQVMSLRIFLCYAHEDRQVVGELYQRLKTEGFYPWMDQEDLLPGQAWELEIPKAVREADIVLACLSPRFVTKAGYGQREIKLALDTADFQLEGTIFVIPLRLEACDVPDRLRRWYWCDYFEASGYDRLLRALHYRAGDAPIAREQGVSSSLPPPVVRARCNHLFPVTVAEWRDELRQRSEVFGESPGYWCYVRPGHYLIGGWKRGDALETITLSAFWIAKHPITVQQYRQFMQTGGYANQKLWTPNGWKWKEAYASGKGRTQPYFWEHERFNYHDNQPVVIITWYEAVAFAAWLSTRQADILPPGYAIRLPTEAEWEAAAAYDVAGKRHRYPWGEAEPDASRADFGKDWYTDQPAPVGGYAAGAAACGAQEMAGSVWEATSSSYRAYPAGSGVVVRDFPMGSTNVPWRGGSWGSKRTNIQHAIRSRRVPDYGYGYGNGGFRVVVSPCLHTNDLGSDI
ncbi:MAG: SUMF1/EgtB/PvdO family nonheme iron enzyme [Chloroflexaceae bacterium]|nr:SUMF1/EgtB/PvdO family nonheme iron enzyme [Chloroflexaceae bacterium]